VYFIEAFFQEFMPVSPRTIGTIFCKRVGGINKILPGELTCP